MLAKHKTGGGIYAAVIYSGKHTQPPLSAQRYCFHLVSKQRRKFGKENYCEDKESWGGATNASSCFHSFIQHAVGAAFFHSMADLSFSCGDDALDEVCNWSDVPEHTVAYSIDCRMKAEGKLLN